MSDEAARKAFLDAVTLTAISVKGILTDPDMIITERGARMLWDKLKLADLEISVKPKGN